MAARMFIAKIANATDATRAVAMTRAWVFGSSRKLGDAAGETP